MGYTREPHTTGNLERTPEGDGVVVFPPCCEGARVFVPLDEALPPANSQLVCPIRGHDWLVELVADETTQCGLRPVWTDREPPGYTLHVPCRRSHFPTVSIPPEEAVPDAQLTVVCPQCKTDGRPWLVELVTDEGQEHGLRPVWTDPETVAAAARVTRLSDTVRLTTPCHGARVDLPADEALPGIQLLATCATEGRRWHVELVVDHEAEAGLHAVWTDPAVRNLTSTTSTTPRGRTVSLPAGGEALPPESHPSSPPPDGCDAPPLTVW